MIPNNAFLLIQDPGKLKLQADGLHFKSSKTNKVVHIKEAEIESGEWLRAARGYEMKVLMSDGVAKFDGFKESVMKIPCVCVCGCVYVRVTGYIGWTWGRKRKYETKTYLTLHTRACRTLVT